MKIYRQTISGQINNPELHGNVDEAPIYIDQTGTGEKDRSFTVTQNDLTVAGIWIVNLGNVTPKGCFIYNGVGERVYADEEILGTSLRINFECFTPLEGNYTVNVEI